MYLDKIIRMILGVILILITYSCNNAYVLPTKKMKQIFYTEEGNPYILKTVIKNLPSWNAPASTPFVPTLHLNYPVQYDNFNPNAITIVTSKKILPLYATVSLIKNSDLSSRIDISTPYYFVASAANILYKNFNGLSKTIPFAQRSYFTDGNHFAFSINYNLAIYSINDFFNDTPLEIRFEINQAYAMNAKASGFPNVLNGENYATSVAITYFELM